MYDYDYYDGAYNADNDGDSGSESEFRRTRINVKGTSGKNWAYKMTVDIDEGEAEIDTGYIKYQGFENVDLLLGRFKAPVGLEELSHPTRGGIEQDCSSEREVISTGLLVASQSDGRPKGRVFFCRSIAVGAGGAGQRFPIRSEDIGATTGASQAAVAQQHADRHAQHGDGDDDDAQYE